MPFYDVNAAIDKPNVLNSFRQGQQYGAQLRQQQQAQADHNALRQLAPQVIGGDPSAYEQAAAIDPEAAASYQGAGDAQMRRLKGAIDFIDRAKASNNPQAVEAAYQQVRPYLARFGQEPPATFAEAEPKMEAARARIAMATSGALGKVQSTYVDEAGNRVAIMRDGSTQVLGRNNASIRVLEQEGQLPYGVVTSGGAAGQVVPLGQGMGGQPPTQPQGWQQAGPVMFAAADGQPIPEEDQAALLRAVQEAQRSGGEVNVPASAPAPQPVSGGALPPRLDYQNGGFVGPVRVPTAAEKAASEAAARRQVELSTLPAELQMRTQAAIEQTTGQEAAKAQADREAKEPQRQEAVRQMLTKVDNVVADIDRIAPAVDWTTAGVVGSLTSRIPGTPSNDLRVAANSIKAGLAFDTLQQMRAASPTGGALGAVSERELDLLQSAVASLDQSQTPEQLSAALRRVRQHYANWRDAVQQGDQAARARAGGASPASDGLVRVSDAAGYDALPSGATYIAPDGTQRRKR